MNSAKCIQFLMKFDIMRLYAMWYVGACSLLMAWTSPQMWLQTTWMV